MRILKDGIGVEDLVTLSRILALSAEKVQGIEGEKCLDPLRVLLSEHCTMLKEEIVIEMEGHTYKKVAIE